MSIDKYTFCTTCGWFGFNEHGSDTLQGVDGAAHVEDHLANFVPATAGEVGLLKRLIFLENTFKSFVAHRSWEPLVFK